MFNVVLNLHIPFFDTLSWRANRNDAFLQPQLIQALPWQEQCSFIAANTKTPGALVSAAEAASMPLCGDQLSALVIMFAWVLALTNRPHIASQKDKKLCQMGKKGVLFIRGECGPWKTTDICRCNDTTSGIIYVCHVFFYIHIFTLI